MRVVEGPEARSLSRHRRSPASSYCSCSTHVQRWLGPNVCWHWWPSFDTERGKEGSECIIGVRETLIGVNELVQSGTNLLVGACLGDGLLTPRHGQTTQVLVASGHQWILTSVDAIIATLRTSYAGRMGYVWEIIRFYGGLWNLGSSSLRGGSCCLLRVMDCFFFVVYVLCLCLSDLYIPTKWT